MNIINKFFLTLALLPKKLYAKAGVNISHLTTIVSVKLMMDDRRPNTFHQTRQRKQEKQVTLATLGTMLLSAVLGSLFLVSFMFSNNVVTQLTLYFSFYIFMLASTLITDFTSVLIDVRDNYIILPKPVNDRTIVVARLLHILIHICKIILPMSLPGLIYMINVYGALASLPFIVMILLATLFTIFLINAVYIIILRVTTPEKFKTIISYIQIGFAVLIYGSYQLIPQAMQAVGTRFTDQSHNNFMVLIPSYWFAAGYNVLFTFHGTAVEYTGFASAIILPLLSIYVVIKYLAPSFNQKLSMIGVSEASEQQATNRKKPAKNKKLAPGYVLQLANIFTKKGAEKMGFLFTWKMTSRSRDFKLKVYPAIGYLVVYIFVMLLRSGNFKSSAASNQHLGTNMIIIMAVYFLSFLLLTAVNQMIYSEKFKAAWLYFITPVKLPGSIILGAVKALLLMFYIPLALAAIITGMAFFGMQFFPNLLFGLFNVILITVTTVYISYRYLPFSVAQSDSKKTGTFIRTFFMLLITAVLGVLHYFISSFLWVIIICSILTLIAIWLVMDAINRTTWQKIKTIYE